MLKITNNIIEIECGECSTVLKISPSDLYVSEEVLDPDREMGPEYEYDFKGEFKCQNCGNDMEICIKGFEYPEGAYNSQDEETHGCSILGGINIVVG